MVSITCRRCGREESLSEPLIDGICAPCYRAQSTSKVSFEDFDRLRSMRANEDRWSGAKFIGMAVLMLVLSVASGFLAQIFYETAGEMLQQGGSSFPYSVVSPVLWITSGVSFISSGVMFIAGIIRFGVG